MSDDQEFEYESGYGDNVNADIAEMDSMLAGVIQIGRIVNYGEGDPPQPTDIPRVLVQVGANEEGSYTRNWMPWISARAGYDAEWWKPEEGEQVVVLGVSGNLAMGVILGSVYRGTLSFDKSDQSIQGRDAIPDEEHEHIHQRVYQDGTHLSYDRKQHKLTLALQEEAQASSALLTSTAEINDGSARAGLTMGDDGIVQVIAEAEPNNEKILLKVGGTLVTIDDKGGIEISASGEGKTITITGDVEVKGTLDVSEP